MRKRILSLALTLTLALGLIPPASALTNPAPGGASSDRGNTLIERADGGFDIVWIEGLMPRYADGTYVDNRKIIVTTIDSEFRFRESHEVPIELPELAGVYGGKNYNFVLFGQTNDEESDSVEVLRVVKYSKNWERLGAASLYGANTIGIVFQHGNRSFADSGDMLYIHCGHAMYKADDGLNHQGNMTLSIRISDMEFVDKNIYVKDIYRTGFTGHSLDQDILIDSDGSLVALDNVDGNPARGAILCRYNGDVESGKIGGARDYAVLARWPGEDGDVTVGAYTFGLVETSQGYISAYADTGSGSDYNKGKVANAYLTFTPKNNVSDAATVNHQITNFAPDADESVVRMSLLPTSSEGGYVMWIVLPRNESGTFTGDGTIHYARYYADGTIGQTMTAGKDVPMPSCGPICAGGKIVWGETPDYDGKPTTPKFAVMDESGIEVRKATFTATAVVAPDPEPIEPLPDGAAFFSDVPTDSWAYPYIKKAYEKGFVKGVGDGKYNPSGHVTYAEFAAMLVSAFYRDELASYTGAKSPWYMPYCTVAEEERLFIQTQTQAGKGAKAMTEPIDRFDMAAMMYFVFERAGIYVSNDKYNEAIDNIPDALTFPHPYFGIVPAVVALGALSGVDDKGTFNGTALMDRSQAAVVMLKMDELING